LPLLPTTPAALLVPAKRCTLTGPLACHWPTAPTRRTWLSIGLQGCRRTTLAAAARRIATAPLPFALALRLTWRLRARWTLGLPATPAFTANGVAHVIGVRIRTTALTAAWQNATSCPATARAATVAVIAGAIRILFLTDITTIDVASCCHTDYHALNHGDAPQR